MELSALAAFTDRIFPFLGETYDVSLNWIGKLINGLIGGIGVVGLGIVVFSLILKLIVLPFDVFQRISMRKQNIKMKDNKERLEKLQKQYANDKKMYSQKVMELQKESGFSLLSSCLPMILSLVIFILAINAFNDFSAYANLQNYNKLVSSYNDAVDEYIVDTSIENKNIEIVGEEIVVTSDEADKYIYYKVPYNEEKFNENKEEYLKNAQKTYYVDTEKTYAAFKDEIDEFKKNYEESYEDEETRIEYACLDFFESKSGKAVVETYEKEVVPDMKFFWVKNIWVTDASYKHPVLEYKEFSETVQKESLLINGEKVKFEKRADKTNSNAYEKDSYEKVMKDLGDKKSQANGYFILIALSIGTILLQQFIMMKSQKEQTQLSSVDGQGAATQKMTLVIMTLVFAVFSFMYSAAFTIYMITSNITSMITTLIINKSVDAAMKRKEAKEMQEHYNKRFPNRQYQSNSKDKKNRKNGK